VVEVATGSNEATACEADSEIESVFPGLGSEADIERSAFKLEIS